MGVKQNRGSAGEGIWSSKLKEGNYCEKYGDRVCEGSEMLILKEANDFHEEEHTVDQFMEFCINGEPMRQENGHRLEQGSIMREELRRVARWSTRECSHASTREKLDL